MWAKDAAMRPYADSRSPSLKALSMLSVLKMYMKFSVVASPPPAATPQRATASGESASRMYHALGRPGNLHLQPATPCNTLPGVGRNLSNDANLKLSSMMPAVSTHCTASLHIQDLLPALRQLFLLFLVCVLRPSPSRLLCGSIPEVPLFMLLAPDSLPTGGQRVILLLDCIHAHLGGIGQELAVSSTDTLGIAIEHELHLHVHIGLRGRIPEV
mmetsp:Transcript_39826/g.81569  ORF Transcript_39826/g.81569 Transcript_39826/m.81569 type:complete len:214 (-) Transcript_39826:181-822(-)